MQILNLKKEKKEKKLCGHNIKAIALLPRVLVYAFNPNTPGIEAGGFQC